MSSCSLIGQNMCSCSLIGQHMSSCTLTSYGVQGKRELLFHNNPCFILPFLSSFLPLSSFYPSHPLYSPSLHLLLSLNSL